MINKLVLAVLPLLLCACISIKQQDQVSINFSTWGSASEIKIVKELIKEYEIKNPNIKINLQHTPQNYFQKLHLQFASKTEPDVILINNQNINKYGIYLSDIDKNKYKTDFYPNTLSSLSVNGKLKAVPRDISTLVVYYNKTLLKENGIAPPEDNWTICNFLNISNILKGKNIFAVPLEDDLFYLYPFILSFGENAENITLNNLYKYESVKFYKDLSQKYHYAPMNYEIGQATGAEFFLNGKCAFYLSGRWMTPKIREKAQFEWDILPFPAGKNGSNVPCDTTGWGITKNTKHPKEALNFVNYLASEYSLEKMSKTGLIVPARKNINLYSDFLTSAPDNAKIFLNLAQSSTVLKYPTNYNITKNKINMRLRSNSRENPTETN